MPILPNSRHERFCQEVAQGRSAVEAYGTAGYAPNRSHASRLVAKGSIRARVEELKMAGAQRAEITIDSLLAEAEDARRQAMEAGQFSAAIAAIREKGVLSGLRVAAIDMTTRGTVEYTISDTPLSPEERDAEWLASCGKPLEH